MVSVKFNKKYIIKSFSKINLHLNVLQKNKNNLHKIESLVMFCGIHDRIELKKSKTNLHNINFVGKYSNGLQKKNTIKDLLSILDKKKYLKNQKFNIKITKNIPHKSGMGGGSMNAASILKFFIDKNFINLQKSETMNVAKKIGSDVVLGLNNNIKLLNSRGKIINVRNRINALKIAEKNFDLAILDDGLQQKNVEYDLKIVCINSYEGFGNNFLIPAGPLRENLHELKNYDIAFLNGFKKNKKLKKEIKKISNKLKIFDAIYEPINLKKFNLKKNFLFFCGIGNPHEFENTLKKFNFKIKKKFIFPDHYNMSDENIDSLKNLANKNKLSIVTTEKDFLRLTRKQQKDIDFLKVKLKIKNVNKFKKSLNKIYEKN